MSGRVRVTLADGRRVTGFRKTLRRNPRKPIDTSAWWVLVIHRRDFGLLLLPCGQTNTIGVRVHVTGEIECRGKDRQWVKAQMAAFLAGLGIVTNLPNPKRVTK